ncbi:MAG: CopG family ribbon-helix-helix protein [Sporichthyaceae bacterium]
MKISVSISAAELATLDAFSAQAGLASRSAAVQHAIRLLDRERLEEEYTVAFAEWDASGEGEVWDVTAGDGLLDAPR